MRSLYLLFLIVFTGHVDTAGASPERRIVQVQFAGIDPVTKRCYVSEINDGPRALVIGHTQPSRIPVAFSPDSDRAALAAFEKIAAHWVFNAAAPSPKISCNTRLHMTLVINEKTGTTAEGNQPQRVTLRDWKLEFPFRITIENPTYADFFSAEYLADSPKIVLGETLFKEIPNRHFTSDPEKLKSFDAECAKTSPYSLQLKARLTADAYQSIFKESQTDSSAPTKLQQQIEELLALVANLEAKNGGCVVSPLIDTGGQWGFTITPPSLVAAGGPTCDHVVQVFLTRAVSLQEWKQTKSEFNKLKQEKNSLTPRYLVLQKSSAPRSTDDEYFIRHFKTLGRRTIVIDNPVDGLPMASYQNLGIIITPALGRPVEAPPISEKSLQAMEAFYRQVASVVGFYNLDEIIALFHPKAGTQLTN
jgi:hypothetical protein